jgi:hypothetical protein
MHPYATLARWTGAACILAAATSAQAATVFQTRCENSIGATVATLESGDRGWSIDNSRTLRTLTAMKGQGTTSGFVLGLTRAESRIAIGLEGKLLLDPTSGYECVAPKVLVKLFYLPIVIYVGSEFLPGTCAYEEILSHEMRHLKVYLAHLPKVEAAVRAALDQRFIAKPLYAPAGQAKALLQEEMDRRWMPFIKASLAKVEPLQAAIDSPQEYARLSKVCKGEVQSLLGRKRS